MYVFLNSIFSTIYYFMSILTRGRLKTICFETASSFLWFINVNYFLNRNNGTFLKRISFFSIEISIDWSIAGVLHSCEVNIIIHGNYVRFWLEYHVLKRKHPSTLSNRVIVYMHVKTAKFFVLIQFDTGNVPFIILYSNGILTLFYNWYLFWIGGVNTWLEYQWEKHLRQRKYDSYYR